MADGADRKRPREIGPQPGPQTDFLACSTDVALYGGSAGGGKSHGLLLDVLNYVHTPGWHGLILRRYRKDLMGAGGLYEKARALYGKDTGAEYRAGGEYVDVRWPSGAMLAFRHLGGGNVLDYQGLEFAWVGIDEATHLDVDWILYLMTRVRTTCGARPAMRLTCNPDPDHPLREWVEPYLLPDGTADRSQSGRVRWFARCSRTDRIVWGDSRAAAAELAGREPRFAKSFAFIPSKLEDNPALMLANPDYEASLTVRGAVVEAQLRHGNWFVRADTGGMLSRARWGHNGHPLAEPLAPIIWRVRAWDFASTKPRADNRDPDYSGGLLLEGDADGRIYIAGLDVCREDTPERDAFVRSVVARDGYRVTQVIPEDPGAGGKDAAYHQRRNIESVAGHGPVITRRALREKIVRATPVARALELGITRNEKREPAGYVLDRDGWLGRRYSDAGDHPPTMGALLWSHLDPFGTGSEKHDDIVDMLSDAHAVGAAPPSRRVPTAKRARQVR